MDKPRLLTRISFWLLLGLLSTFFAEFLSGSAPDFLLTTFGYIGIFPIYCLHTLILVSLVIRSSRGFSLRSLYLASLLFGMYEAYITKVLWEPFWDPYVFRVANVAVFETILLVFFWHAVFSFIIPLFTGETLLMNSRHLYSILPQKWQTRIGSFRTMIFFGLVSSILFGTAAANIDDAITFSLINCVAVSVAILAWRFFTRSKHFDLVDLLPRKLELVILSLLLLLVYLTFGFSLNRHVAPGVVGHTAILVMYASIITLTIISLREDKKELPAAMPIKDDNTKYFGMKHWFAFCGALLAGSILINFLPQDIQDVLTMVMFFTYAGLGIYFVFFSIRDLFRKKKPLQPKIH